MRQTIYLSDLITGMVAVFGMRGVYSIDLSDNRLDRAFTESTEFLRIEAPRMNLQLKFNVRSNGLHSDSTEFRHGLYGAVQRGIVSFECPNRGGLIIKVGSEEGLGILQTLPGSQSLYENWMRKLTEKYGFLQPGHR